MATLCPECGSANGEGANFCQRCGASLRAETSEGAGDSVTATYRIDESGELVPVELDERMNIGRRPDSAVFLDDITVSRDHALLIRRGDDWHLDDCGSLNGTYVNRERIESHRLEEGDELQIGKYKLSYHAR
jgi:pSer/pThr/pTyr-binding forkhead associated (FHA) protein